MKASDISDAIKAMQAADKFILNSAPSNVTEEIEVRTNLIRSSIRLQSELSAISVEIRSAA